MKPTTRTGLIARLIALMLAMALVAGACGDSGSDDDDEAQVNAAGEESDEPSDDTEADDEESEEESGAEEVDASGIDSWELPQSMVFSSIEWTLESADARDRLDPEEDAPDEPETWVAIGWSGTNQLEDTEFEIPAGAFQLLFEDGTYVIGESAEDRVPIQAGASNDGEVAFLIPEDADLATATFQFLGEDREPGSIRLDGTGTPEPERVDAAVTPEQTNLVSTNCNLELTLTDSFFSRELLVQDGVAAKNPGYDTRAREDTVILHLLFDARSIGTAGCDIGDTDLVVDGQSSKVDASAGGSESDGWWYDEDDGGWTYEGGFYTARLPEGSSGPVVVKMAIPDDAEQVSFALWAYQYTEDEVSQEFTLDTSGLQEFPKPD